MRTSIIGMCVLFIVLLTGCGNSEEALPTLAQLPSATPQPSATVPPTATATMTLTPTATTTATSTPIPTATATQAPFTLTNSDGVSLVLESVLFQDVRGTMATSILATMQNQGNRGMCYMARDVRLIIDGNEYAPESGLMADVQDTINRDYLGPVAGQCVDAQSDALTFVTFDAPLTGGRAELRFYDSVTLLMDVWVIPTIAVNQPPMPIDLFGTIALVEATAMADWTDTPVPSATITATAVAVATNAPVLSAEERLTAWLLQQTGVNSVGLLIADLRDDGRIFFYAEAMVDASQNSTALPTALQRETVRVFGTAFFTEFSIILDSGNVAADYYFDFNNDEWRITPLSRPSATPDFIASGTTYYINDGDVRIRSCPQTTCDVVDTLNRGSTVQVIDTVPGDYVRNSSNWYELNHYGQLAYVHSSLANSTPPPTAAPIVIPPVGGGGSSGGQYVCDCTRTCSRDIQSCAEAQYQLNVCGCDERDTDHDGIACDTAPLNCQN